jgi:hypothetical protein
MRWAIEAGGAMIPCDGCGSPTHAGIINLFMFNGIQVRYCPDCTTTWRDFDTTCKREEHRLQRLLDLWIAEARAKVCLQLTPYDFPKVVTTRDGNPVTL